MRGEEHPAAENIRHLRQAIELIRRLDDADYRTGPDSPFGSGVGSQFRHCLDFYRSFLRDLDGGRVDYCRRDRDPRVESDREHAAGVLGEIVARLERIEPAGLDRPIHVHAEAPRSRDETRNWDGSTPGRELQFLLSHTIHHHALIVLLLKLRGRELGAEFAEFGVAPSTLGYWTTSRTPAP